MSFSENSEIAGEGNNKTSPAPARRSLYFTFTHFPEKTGISELAIENCLKGFCKKYFYGIEYSPTTNEKHMQGYFHAPNKDGKGFYPTQIWKKLPKTHVKPSKGNEAQNKAYCSKDGDIHEWTKPEETKLSLEQKLRKDFPTLNSVLGVCNEKEIDTFFLSKDEWNTIQQRELNYWNQYQSYLHGDGDPEISLWFIGKLIPIPEEPYILDWEWTYYEHLLEKLIEFVRVSKDRKKFNTYL